MKPFAPGHALFRCHFKGGGGMPALAAAPVVQQQSGTEAGDALRKQAALRKKNSQTLFAGEAGTPNLPAGGAQPVATPGLKSLLG